MTTKKIASIAVAASMMLAVAGPAMGQTVQDLLNQIAALQAQLQALQGGGQAYNFTRSLFVGLKGDDVTALQNYLKGAGYFNATPTGFFGPVTKAAVAAWQAANGISPAAGFFGPVSIAKYKALVGAAPIASPAPAASPTPAASPAPAGPASEGSLDVKLAASPADNTEVHLGDTAVAVFGAEIKAKTSDMVVKRIDVNFNARPWLFFSNVALYDGANAIKGIVPTSANTEEVTAGSDYKLRFDGLDFVVPKDATKVVTVKVSMPSAVAQSLPSTITVKVKANGVRAVDTLGLSNTFPGSDLTRTMVPKGLTAGSVEASLNSASPAERVVQVSTSGVTDNVEALRVDFKAKDNDVTIKRVKFVLTYAGVSTSTKVTGARLYDGDTQLASVALLGTGASEIADFTDLTVGPIAKDSTKTLTVKLALNKIGDTAAQEGDNVLVAATTTSFSAEDKDFNSIITFTGSVTGKKVYLYSKAPQVTMASASLSAIGDVPQRQASGVMRMNVVALGGDIYIKKNATDSFVATSSASSTAFNVSPVSGTTDTASNWKIASGQTGVFDVNVQLNNTGGTAKFVQAWLTHLKWNTNDGTSYTDWTNQLSFGTDALASDYKTPSVYLSN